MLPKMYIPANVDFRFEKPDTELCTFTVEIENNNFIFSVNKDGTWEVRKMTVTNQTTEPFSGTYQFDELSKEDILSIIESTGMYEVLKNVYKD